MKVFTLYIQESVSKKLYTIYKKPKPYLKSSLHSYIGEIEIYNGFSHFYGKKTN